jgi:heme-degrading monooxygenase HmoA
MIAVMIEVVPRPGRKGEYFEAAARLRPLIEGAVGFVSSERFESLSEQGKFLSLSLFHDEAAARCCLERMEQRVAEQVDGEEIFSLYRVRLAPIVSEGGQKTASPATRPKPLGLFSRFSFSRFLPA